MVLALVQQRWNSEVSLLSRDRLCVAEIAPVRALALVDQWAAQVRFGVHLGEKEMSSGCPGRPVVVASVLFGEDLQ